MQKYGFAFLLALSAGTLGRVRLRHPGVRPGRRRLAARRRRSPRSWNAVRWPLGLLLTAAAVTMLFRWCPRRHQPAPSWLAFGSVVSVVLWSSVTVGLAVVLQLQLVVRRRPTDRWPEWSPS